MTEEDRKLFVGALPKEVKESDIKEYFEQYGEIDNINLKMEHTSEKPRGFAFVTFLREQSIYSALSVKEHRLMSTNIQVMKARKQQFKIFVGNLTPEITTDDLVSHFNTFSRVLSCERPCGKENMPKAFAFITFGNKSIVDALIQKASTTVKSVPICIKAPTAFGSSSSSASSGPSEPAAAAAAGDKEAKLFVYNVSEETAADELKKAFGKHGTITDAYNPGKGFAFVTFSTPDEAQAAISAMNGTNVCGRDIECRLARSDARRVSDRPREERNNQRSRDGEVRQDGGRQGGAGGGTRQARARRDREDSPACRCCPKQRNKAKGKGGKNRLHKKKKGRKNSPPHRGKHSCRGQAYYSSSSSSSESDSDDDDCCGHSRSRRRDKRHRRDRDERRKYEKCHGHRYRPY